ncbi:MAG: pheophorbide a oxygenase, partial [Cyanobacteriota bacterium]|nr:pheophorbide a oxygenase [Cyanobacteriota bacterium]
GMPMGMRSPFSFILVISALLGLGVYAGLKFWLEPKFYFVDYVHADKK